MLEGSLSSRTATAEFDVRVLINNDKNTRFILFFLLVLLASAGELYLTDYNIHELP